LKLYPDLTREECKDEIQRFLLRQNQCYGEKILIAQQITMDYDAAQEEIRAVIKQAGGYLI
jgi:hypothetical protein